MKKYELSEWEKRLVTHIRRNRNKSNLFICTVGHVSRSGMQRHIKIGMMFKGEFIIISHFIAKLADYRATKYGDYAFIVNGCGMDMIFSVLQNIAASIGCKGNQAAFQHYKYF